MTVFQYAQELIDAPLDEEMRKSYLDYAMSVIVGRALPDARDGLKPVHRRALHSMNELNNAWNKPYKKSARVVGDTIGKYHPHGDTAVYEAIVRMAQTFSLRYPLVDGQGNFGSIDGDGAAAMRYTEIRLSKISQYLLEDLEKETVDFVPNYDGSEREPSVMPARFPGLLLNGSEGIAVGMATKIAPHNLKELLLACIALLNNPQISIDELMKFVPAPDFPTGGLILGVSGAAECYRTGSGSIVMRAKTHIEEMESGRSCIVVDELPYQVNKKTLQEKIAELVREKVIEGISNIQDESDKSGIRLVIELKRGEVPEVVLNQLFKRTQLQTSFGANMVALVDGRPEVLTLKSALSVFLAHRREVVYRKTLFELKAAKQKGHLLEGYSIAVSNLDEMVTIIRSSKDPQAAKDILLEKTWRADDISSVLPKGISCAPDDLPDGLGWGSAGYKLSPIQAHEILQLRLQRLTGMELNKIVGEYKQIVLTIADLMDILENDDRIKNIIEEDFKFLIEEFGDARRSQIVYNAMSIEDEDLIPKRDMVVTLTRVGYVKTQSVNEYEAQNRGGRGKSATDMKSEDIIDQVISANSHDSLLCFSNLGRVFSTKVYSLPEGGRGARGRPLNNFLNLPKDEFITSMLPLVSGTKEGFLVFVTEQGFIKRTSLNEFRNIRSSGLNAVYLEEGDCLVGVQLVEENDEILLFSSANKSIRFAVNTFRALSRSARGVRCMKREKDDKIVSMLKVKSQEDTFLVVTEKGYAKRLSVSDFRKTKRTASGVRPFPESEENGALIKAIEIGDNDDIIAVTKNGILLRVNVGQIRELSRNARGSRLLRLDESDSLRDVVRVKVMATSATEIDDLGEQDIGDTEDNGEEGGVQ